MKLTIHDVAYYGLTAVGAVAGLALVPVITALGWNVIPHFTIALLAGSAAATVPIIGGWMATGEPDFKSAIGAGVLAGGASLYYLPQFLSPALSALIAMPLMGALIGSGIGYNLDDENEAFKDFVKSTRAKFGEKFPFLKEKPVLETRRQYGIMNDPETWAIVEKSLRENPMPPPDFRYPSFDNDRASFNDPLNEDWQQANHPNWQNLEGDDGKQIEILPPLWHIVPPKADYDQ